MRHISILFKACPISIDTVHINEQKITKTLHINPERKSQISYNEYFYRWSKPSHKYITSTTCQIQIMSILY